MESDLIEVDNLGRKLEEENLGTVIRLDQQGQEKNLFYYKCPQSREHVSLSKGIIVPFCAEDLKKICELVSLNRGERAKWSCQVKDRCAGRLLAKCCRGGPQSKAKGNGSRKRSSRKCGCTAKVHTASLQTLPSHETITKKIVRVVNDSAKKMS